MDSFKVTGACEHGYTSTTEIPLPLRAVVVDVSDDQDGSEGFIVWLQANRTPEWYVVTVCEVTLCRAQADFIAGALDIMLETEEGQQQAIEFVRHKLGGEHEDEPTAEFVN